MVPPVAGSASRTDPRQLGGHSWQGEAKIRLHLHQTSQADKYLWLLPHPALGLRDLQTTEGACSALNVAQSKRGRKKITQHPPEKQSSLIPKVSQCLQICLPYPKQYLLFHERVTRETEPSPDEHLFPAGIFSGSTQCARLSNGRLVLHT